ncbi:MAG: sugar phosphate isomerase/epimerase [Acidobacteriota bacterium]|nr:sugar phosphate isomerase/epimerase [Acidobacteriota bacterium]
MTHTTRRRFLIQSAATAAGATFWPALRPLFAATSLPNIAFPTEPRERISIASYPFRDFVAGRKDGEGGGKIEIKDFAAHVAEKFGVKKIEPWSEHFRSLDARYLGQIRAGVKAAGGAIVNVAVDGEHSPYAADKAERDAAVAFSKQWLDAAVLLGSPSIRTNMSKAKDSEPDVERATESFSRVAEYAATRNIVVNMENDNPVSEDPFFIVKVIEKVNSPWLHALPDFANTLTTGREEHAYSGIKEMYAHAYNISHVKALEVNEKGQAFHVDMAKTFGILKDAKYKGYCSMEFDSPGDPYKGTAELIETTLKYLT